MEQVKGIPGDIVTRRILECEPEGTWRKGRPEERMDGWMGG